MLGKRSIQNVVLSLIQPSPLSSKNLTFRPISCPRTMFTRQGNYSSPPNGADRRDHVPARDNERKPGNGPRFHRLNKRRASPEPDEPRKSRPSRQWGDGQSARQWDSGEQDKRSWGSGG